jgi:hypothetical protein
MTISRFSIYLCSNTFTMNITAYPIIYGNERRMGIRVEGFDLNFIPLIKSLPLCYYDPKTKLWHMPYTPSQWAKCKETFIGHEIAIVSEERIIPKKEPSSLVNETNAFHKVESTPKSQMLSVVQGPSSTEFIYIICPKELTESLVMLIKTSMGESGIMNAWLGKYPIHSVQSEQLECKSSRSRKLSFDACQSKQI